MVRLITSRWFYALKYAGFLPSDLSKLVAKKVVPKPTAQPPPIKKRGPPLALFMSPTGKGPKGQRVPFVVDDV